MNGAMAKEIGTLWGCFHKDFVAIFQLVREMV